VARWTTAHPHQTIKAIKKAINKKGASFIEVLSQCPVHKKETPVDMIRALKAMTVPLKKAKGSDKIPVGEFCDTTRPEWTEKYDTIIKKASRGDHA
jgi:2-oxoglutarate ferredoxin oxidoreductase subunit beta